MNEEEESQQTWMSIMIVLFSLNLMYILQTRFLFFSIFNMSWNNCKIRKNKKLTQQKFRRTRKQLPNYAGGA